MSDQKSIQFTDLDNLIWIFCQLSMNLFYYIYSSYLLLCNKLPQHFLPWNSAGLCRHGSSLLHIVLAGVALLEVGTCFQDSSHMWCKMVLAGLPWSSSGWESACQCRGHRFSPHPRRIPHVGERLSPRATTAKDESPRACALQQEKPELTATRESPYALTKTHHSQK